MNSCFKNANRESRCRVLLKAVPATDSNTSIIVCYAYWCTNWCKAVVIIVVVTEIERKPKLSWLHLAVSFLITPMHAAWKRHSMMQWPHRCPAVQFQFQSSTSTAPDSNRTLLSINLLCPLILWRFPRTRYCVFSFHGNHIKGRWLATSNSVVNDWLSYVVVCCSVIIFWIKILQPSTIIASYVSTMCNKTSIYFFNEHAFERDVYWQISDTYQLNDVGSSKLESRRMVATLRCHGCHGGELSNLWQVSYIRW